nr:unnamed protein product [Callosobruchus analis]
MHRDGSRLNRANVPRTENRTDHHVTLRKRIGEVAVIWREEKIDTYLHKTVMVDHYVSYARGMDMFRGIAGQGILQEMEDSRCRVSPEKIIPHVKEWRGLMMLVEEMCIR